QKVGNKQIIMITDGEPTAHLEGNEAAFAYPPTRRTLQETLKEVQRCTREGITLNTFMLDQSPMLTACVREMARITRGRAIFAAPRRAASGANRITRFIGGRHCTPGTSSASLEPAVGYLTSATFPRATTGRRSARWSSA